MPRYDTPEPISVSLELLVGNVDIQASERTDTVVEVRPTDPNDNSNVRAAEETTVAFSDGTLRVRSPKLRRWTSWRNQTWSVDVTIELPAGSAVRTSVSAGDLTATGTLGDCTVKTSVGQLYLARTGDLRAHTVGDVTVGVIDGTAEVSSGSGTIRIGDIGGRATVKNSNGRTEIDAVTGDVTVRSANGDITIGSAGGNVQARTAMGNVQVDRAARGTVEAETSFGQVRITVVEGTAAKLDLETRFGQVHSALRSTDGPAPGDEVVTVRGRTSYGDITIGRA